MKIDVNALNLHELDSLLGAAERRKKLLARRRPMAVVRRDLIALAASHGYAIEELIDADAPSDSVRRSSKARSRGRVAPKYRDPANRRHTWSGRGRMPRWLADKVKRGQHVTDFLIPGLARPTAKPNSRIGQRSVVKQD